METLCDVLLVALAADAALTAWFEGSIFARRRAYFEVRDDKIGELMSCPLCLSYHVAFWLSAALLVAAHLVPEPWSYICRLPIFSLAATDIVHWLQGLRSFNPTEDSHESLQGSQVGGGDQAAVQQPDNGIR